jgi:hypothetical protein
MSFWADKISQLRPPPPPQVQQPQPVAPKRAWWGTIPSQQQPQNPVALASVAGYAPLEATVTQADIETCPRCGSDDYASLNPLPNAGGQPLGGRTKQCFDCRYPAPDATGDLVKTGFGGNVKDVQTLAPKFASGPRQMAANPRIGSWALVSTGEAIGNTPVIR